MVTSGDWPELSPCRSLNTTSHLTDDATRRCTPEFMKLKSEAFQKIKEYVTFIETQYGFTPKTLHVDNAKELTSGEVKQWLKKKGI